MCMCDIYYVIYIMKYICNICVHTIHYTFNCLYNKLTKYIIIKHFFYFNRKPALKIPTSTKINQNHLVCILCACL